MRLKRTDSNDPDFHWLVKQLDQDLVARYGAEQEEYDQYNKIENNHTVIVAYDNDEPVGCGCFKPFDQTTVEIKRMFVHPSWRGKGVGAAILSALEKWAAESGYGATILETAIGQPEAIHLYQKQGYLQVPNYCQYANMPKSICMKKGLQDYKK